MYYYPLYSTPIRYLHRLKNVLWYRKTFLFVEHFDGAVLDDLVERWDAGLDPASHPIKGVGTQRVALDKDRMRLRVKPAKTQIVSCLEGSGVKNKRKLCKKVAISLTKSTTLFRKMDWFIFFFNHPLHIRKMRVPLCSRKTNLFVEQSRSKQSSHYNTKNQAVIIE